MLRQPVVKIILYNKNILLQQNYSLKFLLTLLNSNLLNWYFVKFQSEGVHFYPNDAKSLPIPKIDLNNTNQKQQHDELVNLADQMIQIQQKINSAKTDLEKENLQKIANSIDTKIDNIVYKLYNLTEEEIKIINNKNKN